MLAAVFWICAGLIVYTHVGYPLLLRALVALRRRPTISPGTWEELPLVSLIVAAFDEEEVIAAKVANALALDYPRDRLELIVASDGSADATVERARAAGADLVLDLPRGGKVAAQNAAAERAAGEILAFSDANSVWAPDALRHLIEPFADPAVGYACGQVRFLDSGGGNLEGVYWRYEMSVRELESGLAGITAGNGAIYAVRRDSYIPLPRAGSHDLSLPVPARQARPALALRSLGRGRGEDGADAGGRVRPQAADDGRPLGHRRAGRDVLAARLPAALRLRDRLAPAAALRDPVPARDRAGGERGPARPGLGLRRDARGSDSPVLVAALLGLALPAAPFRIARYYVLDHRLDRARALGSTAPRRPRRLGDKAEGTR